MDFSELTDDQLLQLVKAAMQEAIRRGSAVYRAATDSVIDAKEKARIEADAYFRAKESLAQQERDRIAQAAAKKAEQEVKAQKQQEYANDQARIWGKQKAMHQALFEWGIEEPHTINVWSRGGDKRVYFESGKGPRYYEWKICLYLTGNAYHPPGELSVETERGKTELITKVANCTTHEHKQLKEFLSLVANNWNTINSNSTPAMADSIVPFEQHLEKYRKALNLEIANVRNS